MSTEDQSSSPESPEEQLPEILPLGAGGEVPAHFIAYKQDINAENFVAYTQARSEDLVFPDLRLIRYDPQQKVIGVVEMGHPAHEAAHMSVVEQITLQSSPMPAHARLVPLGSPSTLMICFLIV